MRKRTFRHVRPMKIQINQHICAVWLVFVVRMKKLCILVSPKRAQWRFWSDCTNAQTDLNHRRAHMSVDTFSDIEANLYFTIRRWNCNIGIKHGFSCINIRQVPWEMLKAAVFNTSQGTWRMLMHWKTMFDRYYCIKNWKHLLHFLHYFVLPFHRCPANAVFTYYARSKAGQYTSCSGSKAVAPVWSYWKLRSRALTARELPCWYTAFHR